MKDGLVSPAPDCSRYGRTSEVLRPSHNGGKGTAKQQKYLQLCYNSTSQGPDDIPQMAEWEEMHKIENYTHICTGDTQSERQPLLHGYQLLRDILCRLFAAETRFTLKGCLRLNLSFGKV